MSELGDIYSFQIRYCKGERTTNVLGANFFIEDVFVGDFNSFCKVLFNTRVKKRVSERVLRRAMHIIRFQTLRRCLASAKSLTQNLAETLGETFGETSRAHQASPQSLGSDYMHGSPQDSLRNPFFTRVGPQFIE